MAFLCFVSNGLGSWNTTQVTFPVDCSGFVAQAANSYADLDLLFKTYFEFNQDIFSLIVGFNLVAFVMGYGLRRVVRAMTLV